MIRAYHFVGETLRDGSPIPADGVWLRLKGPIEICERGLHASRHVADALTYAPGPVLCLVDMSRDVAEQSDKLVARCRRIVARFDATELLRADARASALSVAHHWKMPPVVREYLETGREDLRVAAWSVARSATRSAAATWGATRSAAAARSAAERAPESAAWGAARSATRSAARERLESAVSAKFAELLRHG